MENKFIHLHLHTKYSLMDSTIKSDELADKLKEQGSVACAVTEHGTMLNMPEAYLNLQKRGIKLIIGLEAYVARRSYASKEGSVDRSGDHLVLLAKNETGYRHLIRLASIAASAGMYYKPRIDKEILSKMNDGIIALSACLGGSVNRKLLDGDYNGAKKEALEYLKIMGEGNYYLEIQRHGLPEQEKINLSIIRLSKETGIPLVATNDTHYINKEDAYAHDVLIAMQDKKNVNDPNRRRYGADEFYLKSPDEMAELFSDIPEAIENTVKIAERCKVDLSFGENKIPPFKLPDYYNGTNYDYLKELVYEGAKWRYGRLTDEIVDRIEYELSVIKKMDFVNYFLITWDFFRFCKDGTFNVKDEPKEGWIPIMCGPGRGSGASSIVLYTTNVTKIDPLKYGLLFERFLDPARISMPDIDSDVQSERREELINYVVKKYGARNVSQIVTFTNMLAKSVLREVCSAFGLTVAKTDKLTAMIPSLLGITIREAISSNDKLAKIYEEDDFIKNILDVAIRLEGLPKNTSVHAAGVLITDNKGVDHHVPTLVSSNGNSVAQFDKDILEDIGMLKMDFLGLNCLSILDQAKSIIKETRGIDVDYDDIYKAEDLAPLSIIREGKTGVGIFQLESPNMKGFMTTLSPTNIEEIIAGISLYRPGPMKEIPTFLSNKEHQSSIKYMIPELESILRETYGVLTYQEQCMKVVVAIAGYDRRDADGFRKVIAKKKEKLLPLHRKWFIFGREIEDVNEVGELTKYKNAIPGGLALGHSREALDKLFDLMEDFGRYSFNKSHAAAYGIVGYTCAYLAYYYPIEYLTAVLNGSLGNDTKIFKYINHIRKYFNMNINPVSINKSKELFSVETKDEIRFTMKVKSSGTDDISSIIKERELNGKFTDIYNFIERCYSFINKATLKSLIAAGAFDEFNLNKASYLVNFESYWDKIVKVLKKKEILNIREIIKSKEKNILLDIDDYDHQTILNLEKKFVGVYVTGHPLSQYAYTISTTSNIKLEDVDFADESKLFNGMNFRIICLVDDFVEKVTKKKELMANITLFDMTGMYPAIAFPRDYANIKDKIYKNEIYLVEGTIKVSSGNAPMLIVNDINRIENQVTDRVIVHVNSPEDVIDIMGIILSNSKYKGIAPLYVDNGKSRILLDKKYWVNPSCFKKQKNIEIMKW